MVIQGQMAPDFTLPRDGGGNVTLSALRPALVLIVTYGGDGTPTCTSEVMEFNALHGDLDAMGVTVLGLSKDSVTSHDRFRARMAIRFALLSDHGTLVMDAWGAFGEKRFFGRKVQGVLRQTFLVDGTGRLDRIWQVDRVKGHAAEVLAYLRSRP